MTGVWESQAVPRLTNLLLASREVGRHRSEAVRGLAGTVLEIGFGSGLNVPFYPSEVEQVLAVEPSSVGRKLASRRVAAAMTPIRHVGLDGQDLALEDGSVDAVLSTFTLCTIPDASAALGELRRVLRPGGALHVLEHGLAPDPAVAARQHRLNGMQQRLFGGCNLDRPMDRIVDAAGFDVDQLENDWMPGPSFLKPWNYLYIGAARRSG